MVLMMLQRWDEKERQYRPYEVPDDWHVTTYETDMDTTVNCCQCGREVHFGETFTSMQVHTRYGIGYAVCDRCYYGKEWPERDAARKGPL